MKKKKEKRKEKKWTKKKKGGSKRRREKREEIKRHITFFPSMEKPAKIISGNYHQFFSVLCGMFSEKFKQDCVHGLFFKLVKQQRAFEIPWR